MWLKNDAIKIIKAIEDKTIEKKVCETKVTVDKFDTEVYSTLKKKRC
jgi:hypothetical protein